MTTVFIGGSRAVSRLNSVISRRLDDLIERNCMIFVGDANGADKAVQEHLADRTYPNVLVYCMDRCRNNLGDWPTKQLTLPGVRKDFAYYAEKDAAMAQDAQCGVMLWDGESKGTLNNIQNLISSGKKVMVYLAQEKAFHSLSFQDDLHALLDRCDPALIEYAQRQIRTKVSGARQLTFHLTHD